MYSKWFISVLTILSCLSLMASAAHPTGGHAKRLKQFQPRRPSGGDGIVARGGTVVERAKRDTPSSYPRSN